MRLEELLKNRLKSLYRSLNKTYKILNSNKTRLNEINENIDLLNIFLEDIKDDTSIRNINTGFITELLQKYHYIDGKKIEEDLKVIKILLKGIHDNNLKITLNQEQKEVLIFYKDSVMKLVSELNETKVKTSNGFKMNNIKVSLDLPTEYNFHNYIVNGSSDIIINDINKDITSDIGLTFRK